MSITLLKTIEELRAFREPLWPQGKTLSFVPTMGALHEGHLSLIKHGQSTSDICLPYIFLNPKQFAENEDLDCYPKKLDDDIAKLENIGVTHLYLPFVHEIYPSDFQTTINVTEISKPLEGAHRPNFFQGVCTIVCKMLIQCLPDIAIFGEKDFQQYRVIEQMVKDLSLPIDIQSHPTMRDKHGLALSSRNQYLNNEQLHIARQLNIILKKMAQGTLNETQAHKKLFEVGFDKIDYCTMCNDYSFLPENANRVFAAVWLGQTRLIDNMPKAT